MYKNFIKYSAILFCSSFLISNSFADFASDSIVTGLVKSKIATDSALKKSKEKIHVTTNDGVVTLKGTVNTELQANSAVQDAQSVHGVKDVDTANLKVKSSAQPFTDSYITAKIKGKFIQEKLFENKEIASITIKVETNNGIVALGGTADNETQVKNAIRIAKSVSGVKEVNSNVKFK